LTPADDAEETGGPAMISSDAIFDGKDVGGGKRRGGEDRVER
jgi:hypothetical protein